MQGVTSSAAVICWVSEGPDAGVVEYGKTPELGRKGADARVGRRHAVALADLDPGSTYHYRVEGDSAAFLQNFHPSLDSPRSTKRYYSFDWSSMGDAA